MEYRFLSAAAFASQNDLSSGLRLRHSFENNFATSAALTSVTMQASHAK